jgi:hypothetical protein
MNVFKYKCIKRVKGSLLACFNETKGALKNYFLNIAVIAFTFAAKLVPD